MQGDSSLQATLSERTREPQRIQERVRVLAASNTERGLRIAQPAVQIELTDHPIKKIRILPRAGNGRMIDKDSSGSSARAGADLYGFEEKSCGSGTALLKVEGCGKTGEAAADHHQ
jgi:hypothetical protein